MRRVVKLEYPESYPPQPSFTDEELYALAFYQQGAPMVFQGKDKPCFTGAKKILDWLQSCQPSEGSEE